MSKNNVVLYHANCTDGLSSAWMAKEFLGDDADYIPVSYGKPAPDGLDDKDVYILDFCYPPDELLNIAVKANKLVVLDHHKTAQEYIKKAQYEFEGVSHVHIHFDMEQSGAGLTRRYFDLPKNWWVDYVEDRDLWRFKLPDSEVINAFIQSIPRSIEAYAEAYAHTTLDQAKTLGEGSRRYLEMYVREMVKQARPVYFAGYDNIPCVNAPYVGISELVGELAKDAPFAMGWFQGTDGNVLISLRSRGDIDVSEIAQLFGGGGHRGAAGFRMEAEKWAASDMYLRTSKTIPKSEP